MTGPSGLLPVVLALFLAALPDPDDRRDVIAMTLSRGPTPAAHSPPWRQSSMADVFPLTPGHGIRTPPRFAQFPS